MCKKLNKMQSKLKENIFNIKQTEIRAQQINENHTKSRNLRAKDCND